VKVVTVKVGKQAKAASLMFSFDRFVNSLARGKVTKEIIHFKQLKI